MRANALGRHGRTARRARHRGGAPMVRIRQAAARASRGDWRARQIREAQREPSRRDRGFPHSAGRRSRVHGADAHPRRVRGNRRRGAIERCAGCSIAISTAAFIAAPRTRSIRCSPGAVASRKAIGLRSEMDKLREDNRKLKERLDKLEAANQLQNLIAAVHSEHGSRRSCRELRRMFR